MHGRRGLVRAVSHLKLPDLPIDLKAGLISPREPGEYQAYLSDQSENQSVPRVVLRGQIGR